MRPHERDSLTETFNGDGPAPAGDLGEGPHDEKRDEHRQPRQSVNGIAKRGATSSQEEASQRGTDNGRQIALRAGCSSALNKARNKLATYRTIGETHPKRVKTARLTETHIWAICVAIMR